MISKKRYYSVVGGNPRFDNNEGVLKFNTTSNGLPNQLAAFKALLDLKCSNKQAADFNSFIMVDHVGNDLVGLLETKSPTVKQVTKPKLNELKSEIIKPYKEIIGNTGLKDWTIISEASLRMIAYDILRDFFSIKDSHDALSLKEMEIMIEKAGDDAIFAFESLTNSKKKGQTCGIKNSAKTRNEPWVNCEGIFLSLWLRLVRNTLKQIRKDNLKVGNAEIDLIAFFGEDREVCNRGVITKSMELFLKLFKEYKNVCLTSVFVEARSDDGEKYKINKVFSAQSNQAGLLVCAPQKDSLHLNKISELPNQGHVKWDWDAVGAKFGTKCTF